MHGKKILTLCLCFSGLLALSCGSDTIRGDGGSDKDSDDKSCASASDCADPDYPVCSADGKCVSADEDEDGTKGDACKTSSDCADPVKPVCSAGTCVAKETAQKCKANSDCADPAKPVCGDSGICRSADDECAADADCASGMICEKGKCADEQVCDMIDTDGDTIADVYEGRDFDDDSRSVDTDGDTIPDYKDADSDGDTIPDRIEGGTKGCSGAEPIDSDGDGVPDFRSSDSDSNGIPDMYEGCPMTGFVYIGSESPKKDKNNPDHVCNAPIDTDGDTIPDYQSFDNDGDGVSDEEEIVGLIASSDDAKNGTFSGDCDGDGRHDPIGSAAAPIDCDGDTIPDYMDADSDGDGIPDRVENRYIVTDVYARYSQDADGDGMPDSDEAGEDPNNPRDTDGDGVPDYLDLDSDGDGLSDAFEYAHRSEGYNPYLADSDGDGATDLIEFGAGTNPGDPADNPKSRGNFVFLTPYGKESTPAKETLSFETSIQTVDLFFAFDHTGSMGDEINSLREGLKSIISSLQCADLGRSCTENNDCKDLSNSICSEKGRCITSPKYGNGCFDNMWTGLGYYSNENTFWVAAQLSADSGNTITMMDRTFRSSGSGSFCSTGAREVPYQAPICAVLGENKYNGTQLCKAGGTNTCFTSACSPISSCKMNCSTDKSRIGCAGFREDAIRIYLQGFDEEECYSNGNDDAAKVRCGNYQYNVGPILKENKIRFIGLYSDSSSTYKDYRKDSSRSTVSMQYVADYIGTASGTVDTSGKPFSYLAADKDLSTKVIEGIRSISKNMPVQITTEVTDIDAGASKLVARLEVNTSGETVNERICTNIDVSKIVSQQYPAINNMLPGTSLCFDVIAVQNQQVIKPQTEAKVYKARISVLGDGSVLNSGIAYFLVPGEISNNVVN